MAITTMYRGIEYRSRLEARWAAFFTGLGWHYTYEPFDGDGYIPDFLIHGEAPLLIEVKPAVTMADYRAPIEKAERGLGAYAYDILIVGADPLPGFANSFGHSHQVLGLLGERNQIDLPSRAVMGSGYDYDYQWSPANWMECTHCRQIGVFHDVMSYHCRPCGHGDGDHYLGGVSNDLIRDTWATACNDVKWRGRSVDQPQVVGLKVISPTTLPPKKLA